MPYNDALAAVAASLAGGVEPIPPVSAFTSPEMDQLIDAMTSLPEVPEVTGEVAGEEFDAARQGLSRDVESIVSDGGELRRIIDTRIVPYLTDSQSPVTQAAIAPAPGEIAALASQVEDKTGSYDDDGDDTEGDDDLAAGGESDALDDLTSALGPGDPTTGLSAGSPLPFGGGMPGMGGGLPGLGGLMPGLGGMPGMGGGMPGGMMPGFGGAPMGGLSTGGGITGPELRQMVENARRQVAAENAARGGASGAQQTPGSSRGAYTRTTASPTPGGATFNPTGSGPTGPTDLGRTVSGGKVDAGQVSGRSPNTSLSMAAPGGGSGGAGAGGGRGGMGGMMPMGGMGGMGGMGQGGAGPSSPKSKSKDNDALVNSDPLINGTWTSSHGFVGGVLSTAVTGRPDDAATPVARATSGAVDTGFGRW